MKKLNFALLFAGVIMLANLFFRLLDQSKLLKYFPFDNANDISSYMAQIHFMKVCGFHGFCPYWYNGFIAFLHSPPGWYFFAQPFYLIFNDVKYTAYFLMVLQFVLAFAVIFYFGRMLGLSRLKRTAFFFFLFANAMAVGNFIRLGRLHEMLAWIPFIALFAIIYHYRNRIIDLKFMIISALLFAAIIITYQSVAILALFVIAGFLLAKRKEWHKIIIIFGSSVALTAFWWWPFMNSLMATSNIIVSVKQGQWILQFANADMSSKLVLSFILPLVMVFLFVQFWKTRKNEEKLIFYLPVLLLGVLFLLRVTAFIPVLNYIFPDPYLFFFSFFALFFLLKINYEKLGKLGNVIIVAVVLFSIASVMVNVLHTPKFIIPEGTAVEVENSLKKLDGSFMIAGDFPSTVYGKAYYSYAPVYLNLTTPFGWYPESTSKEYLLHIDGFKESITERNCSKLIEEIKFLKLKYIITNSDNCSFLDACGLKLTNKIEDVCTMSASF